ncbi:hypothetical protein C2845_PM01G02990 [Panicum miliaceum]|uniref:Uncharacterized protein n=1 Tax=Panicum miliaceum TaxID=4540 RepID=A0A3L6TIE4_PANMI|nr:hypothetical protein C2845_PM01G02990 [Panicum miliaceum]
MSPQFQKQRRPELYLRREDELPIAKNFASRLPPVLVRAIPPSALHSPPHPHLIFSSIHHAPFTHRQTSRDIFNPSARCPLGSLQHRRAQGPWGDAGARSASPASVSSCSAAASSSFCSPRAVDPRRPRVEQFARYY